jgi:hypothetical protein
MPTDLARKKLREAAFFLGEMRQREGSSRLDKEEEFGYCLSAFLSAARSISFVLRKENALTYEAQRASWWLSLEGSTQVLASFMRDQRNAALKEGTVASGQNVEPVPALMADKPHSRSPFSVPVIIQPWAFDEGAMIGCARYVLRLDGVERSAVEACHDYLVALDLLVTRFEA